MSDGSWGEEKVGRGVSSYREMRGNLISIAGDIRGVHTAFSSEGRAMKKKLSQSCQEATRTASEIHFRQADCRCQ